MNTYLVSYDLRAPGKDYAQLHKYLKTYPWAKPLESLWLLKSSLSHEQLRNSIQLHVDSNDKIIVIDVTGGPAAWANLAPEVSAWIKKEL